MYNSLIYKKLSNTNNLSKKELLKKLFTNIIQILTKFIDHKDNLLLSNNKINSKIMIIGDMPSHNDHINKYIFSDESGELLNKMLRAISINKEDVYLTNIIPFYNKESKSIYSIYKSFLKKTIINHISIINPQIILIL